MYKIHVSSLPIFYLAVIFAVFIGFLEVPKALTAMEASEEGKTSSTRSRPKAHESL